MNYTTEVQAGVEWPYSEQPINLGDVEDDPVLLSVASYIDLDAIADFMTKSYLIIFRANCIAPPEYIETKWPIIRERYRSSLQAILDSCIPNQMTGIILKVEHRDVIQGVMALNMAKADRSDLWTNNEFLHTDESEYAWVFPVDGYLRLLSNLMDSAHNESRPILNVPHLAASMDDRYMSTCLTTFMGMLRTIAGKCQYSMLINSYEGVYHSLFKTYITYNNGFQRFGWLNNPALDVRRHSNDYVIYARYIPASNSGRGQRLYLDEAVWDAFNDIFSPSRRVQIPRDDGSPVPSLVSDSERSTPEPTSSSTESDDSLY
ncbi:hypothetical protein F4803DRAFT_547928 [Xylaria telfairii]|nr:hypothetical protein F4803DRAFT_547928 [Xylaria telfairii]